VKAGLLALMLGVSALCQAHEDKPLQLAADGAITGLPAAYSPARLQMVFSPVGDERRLTALRLQIGAKQVRLPTCLLGLIRTQAAQDARLSGSWTHDESVVPHYLNLNLADPGHPASFSLLFNLHDARLIEMDVDIERADDEVQSLPVDLRARCAADELRGVLAAPD
jgi:hypothetical protein